MNAYRTEITLAEDGTLVLDALPFQAGERVEVIVLGVHRAPLAMRDDALPGAPLRYDRPTDPVAEDDWEALR